MKKWFQVSLQTKIVGLSAALIITVIVLLASIFSYMQFVESKRQAEQLALQAAKSISFMPEVKAAFQKKTAESLYSASCRAGQGTNRSSKYCGSKPRANYLFSF